MSQPISTTAIIYAILALDGDITTQKDYLASDDFPEADRADEEDVLSEMEQALMEFIDAYKECRKTDKELPGIEELLNG